MSSATSETRPNGRTPPSRNFSRDERWKDYVDLLPGFSTLDEKTARDIYNGTTDIDYKPAIKIVDEDGKQNRKYVFGVGFIEIGTNDGVVLLSKELKRAFIYQKPAGNARNLRYVAGTLINAASWDHGKYIEDRGILEENEDIPHFELGSEIENEHRKARDAEYAVMGEMDVRPYFVKELQTYYGDMMNRHQEATGQYALDDREDLANWESESLSGSGFISGALGGLLREGVHKIHSAKVKDAAYEKIYQALIEHPAVKDRSHRFVFKRQYPAIAAPVPDAVDIQQQPSAANRGESSEEVIEFPKMNLDHVLVHIRRQLVSSSKDREALQRYLGAYNALRFLRQHGIEWVGDEEGVSDEKLLANIQKIKTEVERDPKAVPSADSPEFYTYIQSVIDRETPPSSTLNAEREPLCLPEAIPAQHAPPPLPIQQHEPVITPADNDDHESFIEPSELSTDDLGPKIPTVLEPPAEQVMPSPAAAKTSEPVAPPLSSKENLPGSRSLPDVPEVLKTRIPPVAAPPPYPHHKPPLAGPSKPERQPIATVAAPVNRIVAPIKPASSVQKEWKRAKGLLNWVKNSAPALIVGGLTGAGVRIGAQFALAAFVTTTPGVVAAIGSAVAIGAVAGGVSKLVTTSLFGGAKKDEKNWRRKAFFQGAAMGALGAGIGAGVTQWLVSNDYLHGFFGHQNTASPEQFRASVTPPAHDTVPPMPETQVAHAPAPTPQPHGMSAETAAPMQPQQPVNLQGDTAHSAPPEADPLPHANAASPVVSYIGVKDILTEEQLEKLPRGLRSLAFSHNPQEIALFCKEASFKLINGPHRNPDALKLGAKLIERGLEAAKVSGLHNSVTEKLHADFAYLKAWGIGADKDTDLAIKHARQAGTVINNYGARLLNCLTI